MLVSSFFSGVRDLVVAPSRALIQSPTDPSRVGIGVAQGTLSLVSHSTSGFFAFMSKLAAGAGQGIATLSLDPEFRSWHRDKIVAEATNLNREYKRRGVKSIRAMAVRPVIDIVAGFGSGLAGIVLSPTKGFRKEGTVGLVKGIGIGGIGIVARPTVGVLDAMAHFAGSIHDVAKMVNLLEKRLQPAVRLRLPYIFTVRNVLCPFNPINVRADAVLKTFSLRQPRDDDILIENLVHVEVLPNNGIDTYCIVTSRRILVVRVPKTTTGPRSPSLCWEVYLENHVWSRIIDHGHSGVALNVIVPDNRSKPTSTPVSDSEIETKNDTTWTGRVPRLPSDTGAHSFDYGTFEEAGGTLAEYFTVVAEYEYRSCLGRVHNAICCVVSQFDRIVNDPSFGYPGNSEGFTSFGILTFEKQQGQEGNSVHKENGEDRSRRDLFPWLQVKLEEGIENCVQLSSETYEDVLLSSKKLGGSPWLVKGRAKAIWEAPFPDRSPEERVVRFQGDPASLITSPPLIEDQDDNTIGDSDAQSSSIEILYENDTSSEGGSDQLFMSTRRLVEESDSHPDDVAGDEVQLVRLRSDDTDQTYASAPVVSAEPDDIAIGSDKVVVLGSAVDSAGFRTGANYANTTGDMHSSEDRLERMEALFERLLIFTTEQTLHRPTEGSADQESLRHEIAVLRAALNQQQGYQNEIEELRREISALREEISITVANSRDAGNARQFQAEESL